MLAQIDYIWCKFLSEFLEFFLCQIILLSKYTVRDYLKLENINFINIQVQKNIIRYFKSYFFLIGSRLLNVHILWSYCSTFCLKINKSQMNSNRSYSLWFVDDAMKIILLDVKPNNLMNITSYFHWFLVLEYAISYYLQEFVNLGS